MYGKMDFVDRNLFIISFILFGGIVSRLIPKFVHPTRVE